MTIHPTHTCFDDAVANLMFLIKTRGRDQVRTGDLQIAHAIICPDGTRLAHAWLEDARCVYFSGVLNGERVLAEAQREECYAQWQIERVVRYSLFEAFQQEQRLGHFGPWDPEIRALCETSIAPPLSH